MLSTHAPIVLGPQDRDLIVSARLLSFANPQGNRYRYRVSGYDQNWVMQAADGERLLSRLPSGNLRIEVQAATPQGDWTPSARCSVEVRPPWWRSGWAIVGYVLLGLIAIAVVALRGTCAPAPSPAMAADRAQAAVGRTGIAGQDPLPGHARP